MLYNQRIKQCISKGGTDETEGLGLIPGTVAPLAADIGPELKVPHMGRLDGKMDFLCEDVFDLLTRLAERK